MAYTVLSKMELKMVVKAVEMYCHSTGKKDFLSTALKFNIVADSNKGCNDFELKAVVQMEVTKAGLALEINGKPYAVVLKDVDINLMVQVVSSLFSDGTLKVLPLNEDYKFESIAEHVKK